MDPEKVRIGTCGWSYPKGDDRWTGLFYPKKIDGEKVDELKYYAERFGIVEINSTFYRPNPPGMAWSWVKRTPEDFKFIVKLWQKFTHPKMYKEAVGAEEAAGSEDVDTVREGIEPLVKTGKLDCLLLQFPTSFKNAPETKEQLLQVFEAFKDYPKALELRHRSWSDDTDVAELLEKRDVSWVQIDEPKFATSIRQDLSPKGKIHYVRLHGRNAEKWWHHEKPADRYDYLYSEEELQPIAEKVKEGAEEADLSLVTFNNHCKGKAIVNALMLKKALELPIEGDYNEPLVEEYPLLKELLK